MCEVLVNDILDELKEENNRLLNDLCFQHNLNTVLENIRNYSLDLINDCKCSQSLEKLNQLKQLNTNYDWIKREKNIIPNSFESINPEISLTKNKSNIGSVVVKTEPIEETNEQNNGLYSDNIRQEVEVTKDSERVANQNSVLLQLLNNNTKTDSNNIYPKVIEENYSEIIEQNIGLNFDNIKPEIIDENSCEITENYNTIDTKPETNTNFSLITELLKQNYNKTQELDQNSKLLTLNDPNVTKTNDLFSFNCNECEQSFDTKLDFEFHTNIVHKNIESYVCNECRLIFNTREELLNHLFESHNKSQGFQCNLCPYRTHSRSLLGRHMKCHSKRTNRSAIGRMCGNCGQKFKNFQLRKRHYKVCPKGQGRALAPALPHPHSCDICAITFDDQSKLTLHRNTHSGEKPYQCIYCSYASVQSSKLTRHMKTHALLIRSLAKAPTNEQVVAPAIAPARARAKSHKCTFCSKTFSAHSKLYIHQRSHTVEKPYRCNTCNFASAQRSKLRRHFNAKSHIRLTQAIANKCQFCGNTFSDRITLDKHLLRCVPNQSTGANAGTSVNGIGRSTGSTGNNGIVKKGMHSVLLQLLRK